MIICFYSHRITENDDITGEREAINVICCKNFKPGIMRFYWTFFISQTSKLIDTSVLKEDYKEGGKRDNNKNKINILLWI